MRKLARSIFFLALLWTTAPSVSAFHNTPSFSDKEVKSRVENMPLCFTPKYNDVVGSYLRTYFEKDRTKAERIIGNTALYFPIFEKYLRENDLPMDLRMLPILESALNPHATSRSNAVGLWQFIQPTADGYGLANNHFVDERKDPHRSTQAAMRFLKKLHDRYGDWALALAAYNGGPTRVNSAIKKARSKNFWKVRKYLPKETRNYIPAFIAAAYLYNYYEYHGIVPTSHSVEIQLQDFIKVYDEISFQQISDITGISTYDIEFLNPSYKQRIIPKSYSGNYLILPQWGCQIMRNYLPQVETISGTTIDPDYLRQPNYLQTSYTVRPGDNIFKVADVFSCEPFNIKYWNNIKTDNITVGQELDVYMTTYSKKLEARQTSSPSPPIQKKKRIVVPIAPIQQSAPKPVDLFASTDLTPKGVTPHSTFHIFKAGESLLDLVAKHGTFSLAELLAINNLTVDAHILPGTKILLP